MIQIAEIAEKIRENLQLSNSNYFTVKDIKGNDVKIRTSNHSANRMNNCDTKTLSFITDRTKQKKSAYNSMINEWVILENGLCDTYESIEYILDNELN